MSKDYYKILDVDKGASQEEIKKAFRKKAHQFHPDKETGDEAKFKEINEAYQVLGKEDKRQQYDQYGSTFDQQGGFGQGVNWNDFMRQARQGGGQNANFDFGDIGDIFGDMFGFGRGRQRKATGNDIQADLEIEFNEAAFGTKKSLELYKQIKCSSCVGNGAEPGTPIKTCETCKGQGATIRVQQTMLGAMQTRVACKPCNGEGKIAETKCKKCSGYGAVKDKVKIDVDIPAGINEGQTLHLHGLGEAGEMGAPQGDLYLRIRVKRDPDFERNGADVHSRLNIKFSQAVLGDKIEVKTIDGTGKLTVPSGTQSGSIFKLKGKGAQRLQNSGRGDQLIEVIVEIPKHLNRHQKKLMKELQDKEL